MIQPQFFITRVTVVGPNRLALSFADGFAAELDLAATIAKYPTLSRLSLPEVFAQVEPDEWQRGLVFAHDDELALASDNLRAMVIEQSGDFSHQQLLAWMRHHEMTLDSAAEALGVSRRMLAYYRSGEKPIPRPVGLAMLGWDVVASRVQEHPFEYSAAA